MIIIFPPMYSWDATAPSGGHWYDSSFAIAVDGLYIRNGETTAVPFEAIEIGASGVLTYSLVNNSNTTVTLTGDPYVAVSGEDFSISTQPSGGTILADGSLDFDITFIPTEFGVRNAYISVANDTDEDPYVIEVLGTGAGRGVFAGGLHESLFTHLNTIDYFTISTLGNASDFGDLSVARSFLSSCSSNTRGVFAGGATPSATNIIDYITISSLSNASSFGELSAARQRNAGTSNQTTGLLAGGFDATNVIEYITIQTQSNSLDFGDLTVARQGLSGFSGSTKSIFSGGVDFSSSQVNTIDYVTISTIANASDFGDLLQSRWKHGSCSTSTTGLVGGGGIFGGQTKSIESITISTLGNSDSFGNLSSFMEGLAATSNSTRGVFGGGSSDGFNSIDYVTIVSPSDSSDFGDLSVGRDRVSACSDSHGGLG